MDSRRTDARDPRWPDRRRELRDFVASMTVLALLVLLAFVVAQRSERQPDCGVTGRLTNQTATGPAGPNTSAAAASAGVRTPPEATLDATGPSEGAAGPSESAAGSESQAVEPCP
ncbi:MAG TPA: hypothetical protein VES21_00490 [Nocardioidaceae bacterium]|nr:hypothetical protein [Nocardioidaceae bacterium]